MITIKKIVILFTLLGMYTLHANINAVVSIVPQKTFIEAIGGGKVNVAVMVTPGNSPHTYEPKPSQMKEIENTDIYFAIGVEFEKAWLSRFAAQNKQMQIIQMNRGIHEIKMKEHHHDEEEHDGHQETEDPHVWTSPLNVKILAKNIYQELVRLDAKNKEYYKNNYEKFIAHINLTDAKINEILVDVPVETKFMVFHPAWGYFARDYGLSQISIEVSGKSPKPKQLVHLIEEAKEEKVKAIFTAPEFSDKVAKQVAKEVGIPVIKVSPLNPEWSDNIINLAKAIAHK